MLMSNTSPDFSEMKSEGPPSPLSPTGIVLRRIALVTEDVLA